MSKRLDKKNHQICIEWAGKYYTDNGWTVAYTGGSTMTDIVASKLKKSHYIRVKDSFADKANTEGASLNGFVQHSLSGEADPIIAEVLTQTSEEGVKLLKINLTNANSNTRVLISRKGKQPEPKKE